MQRLRRHLERGIVHWLTEDHPAAGAPVCDFDRLRYEIRPADVLLIEGGSRVSEVIRTITQSAWSHAALYLGRLADIDDPIQREHVGYLYDGDPHDQLIIEAALGRGTVIRPLDAYAGQHLRICRPAGLSRADAQAVINHALMHLGCDYDWRQILDLARFLFPYGILPRRWRSSLFAHNAGIPTRTVCSSMIAAAFDSVHFPILPVVQRLADGQVRLMRRNTRLYTPRDFDYSPYFEIIKYPEFGVVDRAAYRSLPWDREDRVCSAPGDCLASPTEQPAAATADGALSRWRDWLPRPLRRHLP